MQLLHNIHADFFLGIVCYDDIATVSLSWVDNNEQYQVILIIYSASLLSRDKSKVLMHHYRNGFKSAECDTAMNSLKITGWFYEIASNFKGFNGTFRKRKSTAGNFERLFLASQKKAFAAERDSITEEILWLWWRDLRDSRSQLKSILHYRRTVWVFAFTVSCMLLHCWARKIEKLLRGWCVQFNKLLPLLSTQSLRVIACLFSSLPTLLSSLSCCVKAVF